ncbi:MAG TPA: hypothetical protein VJ697_13215 [Nitrososphaeraceae archaeon]|nr:hypothetical protein [Nitrososphaeraceae archaeon]
MANEKEETKNILDQQKQQQIANTFNTINNNINRYQQVNQEIIEENIKIANIYQEQIYNIIKRLFDNYLEAQKNFLYNFQPELSRFLDNIYNKDNWNNFEFLERYTDIYNKTNKNISDHRITCSQRLNNFALISTESFNKSIEITQKYYDEYIQNYLNFGNKIGRSYHNL